MAKNLSGYSSLDTTNIEALNSAEAMIRRAITQGSSVDRYASVFWQVIAHGIKTSLIKDELIRAEYESTLVASSQRDSEVDLRAWSRESAAVSAYFLSIFSKDLLSQTAILGGMYIIAPQLDNQLVHVVYAKWALENSDFFVPQMQQMFTSSDL